MKTLVFAAMLFMQAAPQPRIQPGVISGQVRMADGSPAVGIRVAAQLVTEAAGQGGGSMLSALAQTDDAGRYRLESVLPGRYHIIAGFIDYPTYYPGVKALADSRLVTVEPGSTIPSIDFALARPAGIRVSGRVTGLPATLPPGFTGLFSLVLQPSSAPTPRVIDAPVQSDGSFEFLKVAPGTYVLRLFPAPALISGLPTITVDDKDIGGIEVVAPRVLVGRVTVEGGGPFPIQAASIAAGIPDPPLLLQFQARRVDLAGGLLVTSPRSDGMFVWPMPAGEYQVGAMLLPIGYYVKSMFYGTSNLLQEPLKVSDASDSEIYVTLTTTRPDSVPPGVTVSGRLTGTPAGTSGPPWIAIQTRSAPLMTEIRVSGTLVRADGSFEIPNVPPGTYLIRPIFPASAPIPTQTLIVADRDVTGVELTLANTGQSSVQSIRVVPPPPPPPPPTTRPLQPPLPPVPAGAVNDATLSTLFTMLRQGNSLDVAQADAIEKRLETSPGVVQDRVQLLGYYYLKQSESVAAAKRRPHVLWLIENYPASQVAGRPEAQLRTNDPGLPAAREIWLKQVANHPDDPAILLNVGNYFITTDPLLSERMFLKGQALQPGNSNWPTQLGQIYKFKAQTPSTSNLTLTVPEASAKSLEEYEKAFGISRNTSLLASLADAAQRANVPDKAVSYATQAIGTGESDAVHDGNHTLGEMALEKGDLTAAKNHLLASGKVPTSPVLSSFGPRMKLANALLKKGERAAVQTYLEECLAFWTSGENRLKGWIDSLKQGATPDLLNSGR